MEVDLPDAMETSNIDAMELDESNEVLLSRSKMWDDKIEDKKNKRKRKEEWI